MKTEFSNKLVVSVGAGSPQVPFIQTLKDRGFKVASFGKGRNDEEAISLSDYFSEIDTSNFKEAINWLNSLPFEVGAVGSYAGGVAINTLQEISRYYNLPTNIPVYLSVGMDKLEQQKLYEEYNLSTIKTFGYNDLENTQDIINEISNFIIKPAIGRGSAGVSKVNQTQLKEIINKGNLNKGDMIQELRTGEEYRMLIIIQNYELKLIAPIKRESFGNTFLLGRLSYNPDNYNIIESYVQNMTDKLNLKDVIIKADVIVNGDIVDMIEMDIGVGGGIYYKQFIEKLFNYDITNEYINLITGGNVTSSKYVNEDVVMDYVYNLSGKPISFNKEKVQTEVSNFLQQEISIVQNLLQPEKSGKFSSNSHFIFCIIHRNSTIDNNELNQYINQNLFKSLEEKSDEN